MVVTFGYAAFLIGPAVVGFLVSHLGIQHAMSSRPCSAPASSSWPRPCRVPTTTSARAGPDRPEPASYTADVPTPGTTDPARAAERDEQDEVDGVVEAWRRERPDLDVTPMQVLSRVSRLARHLDRERARRFAGIDLEYWEFDVLAALRRAGSRLPADPRSAGEGDHGHLRHDDQPGRPAHRPRISSPASRHPDDRRAVLVRLTDDGRHAVDTAVADLMAAEQRILAALAPGGPDRT